MRVVSARPTLMLEGGDSCRGSIDTEESRFGETDTKKRANEIDEYSNEGHQRVLRVRGAYEKPRASDLELIAQQVVVAFRAPHERLSHWLAHLAHDAAGRQDEGRARCS